MAALIREARDGNRAGIAAVRTVVCRHDEAFLGRHPDPLNRDDFGYELHAWDCWLDGDTVRTRQRDGTHDIVHRGDRRLWFIAKPGKPPYVQLSRTRRLWGTDIRKTCLFQRWDLSAPDEEDLSLADMLSRPHEVWAARRAVEDGVNSIHLDLVFQANRIRLWLDPARNHLVWKAIQTKANDDLLDEYRVTEFHRATDRTQLPVRIENRFSRTAIAPLTVVTVLSEVRLNEPVPAESFHISGLQGLRGVDQATHEAYRLDADGNPVSPWKVLEKPHPEPSSISAQRVATYILCGLAALGLVVAGASYWRRKRSDRGEAKPPNQLSRE